MDLKNYLDLPIFDTETFKYLHRHEDLMVRYAANNNSLEKLPENGYKLALLGVPEDRNSTEDGAAQAPELVRQKLYELYTPCNSFQMIDLGNIKQGKSVKDTYRALFEVYGHLLALGIRPVIIGGTQDLVVPIFKFYHKQKQPFNLTNIDARFDLGYIDSGFDNRSFLSEIIHKKSPYLFNYVHIGYQTYYVSQEDTDFFQQLWFDCIRLGTAREDISENEPLLRDSDFVCIDIRSIRQSDAPAVKQASIHGFYGEEACQLAKYAGLSDRLSGFGVFDYNPKFDRDMQTAELTAQIIWHFIQGSWLRKSDFPARPIEEYRKFIVPTPDHDSNLIFYNNPKNGRWWMEVPYTDKKKEQIIIVSCSQKDYNTATNGDVPDRWWLHYQKLSSAAH